MAKPPEFKNTLSEQDSAIHNELLSGLLGLHIHRVFLPQDSLNSFRADLDSIIDDSDMTQLDELIVIVGGGGHALVVADAMLAEGAPIEGFLDDDPDARLTRRLDRLGGFNLLDESDFIARCSIILGIGDLAQRSKLISRLDCRFASIIHPSAWVSPTATIGVGVYVGPCSVVHTDATIGDHAIINSAAVVEHDCVVGANSHIAPHATLGGDVSIGAQTLIGIGSTTLPGVAIGDRCTLGGGSVVIGDLPSDCVAMGVPAQVRAKSGA